MWKDRRKRLLLLAALLLLVVALFWNFSLNRSGEAARLARYLNTSFGYQFFASDFYAVDDWANTSIRRLLPDTDLEAVVQASLAAGFPSNIDREGTVTMVVANTPEEEVVTLFLLDGEIEVGFSQWAGVDAVRPLGAEGA